MPANHETPQTAPTAGRVIASEAGGAVRRTASSARYLLLGVLAGLTWAAGFRGWMAELARGEGESSYSWLTVVLILMPGAAIGLLLGAAAHARSRGARPPRGLVFAPALFATALLDPEILRALIRNGQGGGALMVVATALAAGYTLSRRRWGARARSRLLSRWPASSC